MSTTQHDIFPGTGSLLAGKYLLERRVAAGGMGAVWAARRLGLGDAVAVKLMHATQVLSPEARTRFEREARAAAQIQSNHVVRVLDYGVDGNIPFLVMELLEGEDLGRRLRRQGRLSLPETSRVLRQIARALRRAHAAGFVHRDLKPANVFLARSDDEELVKLLDFGIAKEVALRGTLAETRPGDVLGSPDYMSPEQLVRGDSVDARADLWALGVLLYRMLVGTLPFADVEYTHAFARVLTAPIVLPSVRVSDLPPGLDAFFTLALSREPEFRFATVDALVGAFHTAISVPAPLPSLIDGGEWSPPPTSRQASTIVPPPATAPPVAERDHDPVASTPTLRTRQDRASSRLLPHVVLPSAVLLLVAVLGLLAWK
jgi:serine/threonine-protein kinase